MFILIYLLIGCLCDLLAFVGLLATKEEWMERLSFKTKLKLHLTCIVLWPIPICEIAHAFIHGNKEELNDAENAFDEVIKREESKK